MDLETVNNISKLNDKRLKLIRDIQAIKDDANRFNSENRLQICRDVGHRMMGDRFRPISLLCHNEVHEIIKNTIISECKKI